jgi:hypothetical protein
MEIEIKSRLAAGNKLPCIRSNIKKKVYIPVN